MGECVGFGLLSYFMNFGQLLGSYGNLGRRPSQTALGKNFCRSEESKELGIGLVGQAQDSNACSGILFHEPSPKP